MGTYKFFWEILILIIHFFFFLKLLIAFIWKVHVLMVFYGISVQGQLPHPVYELYPVVLFTSYDPKDTSNAVEFGGLPNL